MRKMVKKGYSLQYVLVLRGHIQIVIFYTIVHMSKVGKKM